MSASTPPPYRCPTCEHGSEAEPRNLAVFIDGTSNKPGENNTNVWKLHSLVKSERESSEPVQRSYYLKGIGAYDPVKLPMFNRVGKAIYSTFEMGFAWNVDKNVVDAYTWLVETYREGDRPNRLYLFGFSRGAYQVRKLASMIHEVGLVKEKHDIDDAYRHYLAIDPYRIETREKALMFRKQFCWPSVRIHFVGVWDTVSSLGLIKKDVHITASATVTNACHFRHALALDERRVKFMPEYFSEVNAHHSTHSQRQAVSDVKEVWFPGCHSDVGGTSRGYQVCSVDDDPGYPVHAGNVPLLWMRREAATNGLVFEPEEFTWDPEDVDLGRKDSMTLLWKVVEFLPIRHQVSFSGTGTHKRRWHRLRPRSVIPDHHVHYSALTGDVYIPRANLRGDVDIPIVRRRASNDLWASDLPDEGATTHLLQSLLSDPEKTLGSLEKVLFLLDSRLENELTPGMLKPQWSIDEQSGFNKLALTVIYDVLSNFSATDTLLEEARDILCDKLSSPTVNFGAFYVLRFLARNESLRQRFIVHEKVIGATIQALEWTAKGPNEFLFLLVTDSLRYLINDDGSRSNVVDQLSSTTETEQTRLSMALEVNAPNQLTASLKMIASLAQYHPDLCEELKPKVFSLAETERSPVGPAAVEVLATLATPLTCNIDFTNVLAYLGSILPPLDVEVGGSSSDSSDDLPVPPVLHVKDSGKLNEDLLRKLVLAIESGNPHERTAATLTLLKLCKNVAIQEFCSQNKVVHIFVKQLERKDTSLLAAYALRICLKRGMVASSQFSRAAQLIVAMLDGGWFDDAVGRLDGFEVFRGLMESEDLRRQVITPSLVSAIVKKLERGERHEVRASLICLPIVSDNPEELQRIVEKSVANLKAKDKKTQTKGVKTLAALAQTEIGEQTIKPHVIDIVKMLLPPPGSLSSSRPRSQSFGPTAALFSLAKNETLRQHIKASQEFSMLKDQRRAGNLHSPAV